ncbi:hypothetical protein C8258_08790 [Nocardia sp. MDA0666]|uniref:hypothetical protein n=1 Tax=Nocardia sp. MDA0666 TaxID=2135448 RepID=UPI000D120B10|nr:hypothetical protein [Nocardia sp. MDA0666]PSR68597.1 hypothetical protein C8258_08790 [Nocardia sp. MDA0666]
MSNSTSQTPFSASTRPLAMWTPGSVSPTEFKPSSRRQNVYNFNNLNQEDTARLVQRVNLGRRMKTSAQADTRTTKSV